MGDVAAVLIDVYETALTCDFVAHSRELPALAGVSPTVWDERFRTLAPAVMDGRMRMADAFAAVIRSTGGDAPPALLEELVRRDQSLLLQTSRLHDDTVPFLETLRRRGVPAAFVSNCAENTGPLLAHLGLSGLVDAVVLSCDVGHAKPAGGIFRAALDQLAVPAHGTLFVDDQETYCLGATALGIDAVRIDRAGTTDRVGDGTPTVRSLAELEALL